MIENKPLNNQRAFLGWKAVCYLALLILSMMVEDFGEFQAALLCSIIIAELMLPVLLQHLGYPWLARPWAGAVVAFLLTNLILLIWTLLDLPDPFHR